MKLKYGLIAAAICVLALIAFVPWSVAPSTRQNVSAHLRAQLGLSLTAQDDMSLYMLPFAHIAMHDVTIRDAHGLNIHAPQVNAGLDLWALLTGHIRIGSLAFETSTITINLDEEDNGTDEESISQALVPNLSQRLGALSISDSSVHIISKAQDMDAYLQHVSMRLIWPQLTSPAALEGRLSWQNKSLNFAAWIGNPSALMHHEPSLLSFKINSDSAQLKSSGQLSAGPHIRYEGQTDARYISLHDIAYLAGAVIPSSFQADITSLSALTLITPHALTLSELRADYGQHKIEGSLSIEKKDHQRPIVSATLAADEINITPKNSAKSEPTSAFSAPWSQTPFTSIYNHIGADLDMRISIGRLRLINSILMRDTGISILLNNGRLDLALAEARLHRGTIKGRFFANPVADGFATALTTSWTQVEVSALLTDALKNAQLTGQSDGTIDVSAQGNSMAQLMAQLHGKANITINNGDITGFDIEQALRRLERKPLTLLSDMRTGRTGFDRLQLNAYITQGRAELTNSTLTGPAVQFDITGALDAPTQMMDISILAQQNNATENSAKLSLLVKGPWINPKMSIDAKALLNRP